MAESFRTKCGVGGASGARGSSIGFQDVKISEVDDGGVWSATSRPSLITNI